MLYQNRFQRYAKRYFCISRFSLITAINQNLKAVTSVELSENEATFIDSLRGLHGKKEKLKALKFASTQLGYSISQLLEIFPNYQQ